MFWFRRRQQIRLHKHQGHRRTQPTIINRTLLLGENLKRSNETILGFLYSCGITRGQH
jgi:hypothetical protein